MKNASDMVMKRALLTGNKVYNEVVKQVYTIFSLGFTSHCKNVKILG